MYLAIVLDMHRAVATKYMFAAITVSVCVSFLGIHVETAQYSIIADET